MTLLDICKQLDDLDDDGVLYAELTDGEFTPASRATVVIIPSEEIEAPTAEIAARHCPGLSYCLEVSIAKNAIKVWSMWHNSAKPTAEQRAEAVCYKANYDAWGPPKFPTGDG